MRSLVLSLVIFGLVPFIFASPYIGLLVWSWIGYMNPHRLTYGFAYSFPWVQLVAVTTLACLVFSKENKKIGITPTVVLLTLFFLWTTVTTPFAAESAAAWQAWSAFAKIMVMVAVTLMLVKSQQRIHLLIWVITLSIAFYGVKGGLFTLLTGGGYHVRGPPQSFIGANNGLGMALCMVVPLLRYLQLQSRNKYLRIGLGGAMFLTCIAVFGTYSRAGFVALAVVVFALVIKGRRRAITIAAFVIVAVIGYQFMPAKWSARMETVTHASSVNSFETRVESWKFATNVALSNPILGGGFKVWRNDYLWRINAPEGAKQRAVHSFYFRVLGEQGFPGLALFLLLLLVSMGDCARVRRKTRNLKSQKWAFDLASMIQVSLLAFMVEGLVTPMYTFDLGYQLMAMGALLSWMVVGRGGNKDVRIGDADRDQPNDSARISHVQHSVPRL